MCYEEATTEEQDEWESIGEHEEDLGTGPEPQHSEEEGSLLTGEEPPAVAESTVSSLHLSLEELADRKAKRKLKLQLSKFKLEAVKEEASDKRAIENTGPEGEAGRGKKAERAVSMQDLVYSPDSEESGPVEAGPALAPRRKRVGTRSVPRTRRQAGLAVVGAAYTRRRAVLLGPSEIPLWGPGLRYREPRPPGRSGVSALGVLPGRLSPRCGGAQARVPCRIGLRVRRRLDRTLWPAGTVRPLAWGRRQRLLACGDPSPQGARRGALPAGGRHKLSPWPPTEAGAGESLWDRLLLTATLPPR
ncbi:hypothetical protein NDU88_000046 [Pleurodeles waltl]|uniref:Uncharacterized protein n=1 Tax=Pleurodeles waltl TaxID=8319 RepID=A0AAV7U496_PLEWA|nr:hypothetical protein NDU88_000046 [Pleurodeles waltl]